MELLFFYRPGCPYCREAETLLQELTGEHEEYEQISIRRIDETSEGELADQYDYWYVPTFWLGEEKLYEADPADRVDVVREKLNGVLRRALEIEQS